MAPEKVDKLITLNVAKLITLWRPKGGQANNSPTYIYMPVGSFAAAKFSLFGKDKFDMFNISAI